MNAAGTAWNDQLYGDADVDDILVAIGKLLLLYEFNESTKSVVVMENNTKCDIRHLYIHLFASWLSLIHA
jgi:hypothetical protein